MLGRLTDPAARLGGQSVPRQVANYTAATVKEYLTVQTEGRASPERGVDSVVKKFLTTGSRRALRVHEGKIGKCELLQILQQLKLPG